MEEELTTDQTEEMTIEVEVEPSVIDVIPQEEGESRSLPNEFDFEYARDLRDNFPSIWSLFDTKSAKDTFYLLDGILLGKCTDEALIEVCKRTCDRIKDSIFDYNRAAGVVMQMHYGIVGCLGMDGMKAVIEPLKREANLRTIRAAEVRNWLDKKREFCQRSGGSSTQAMPEHYVRAMDEPGSSVDTEARTTEFSFSSENAVERWDWWYGRYYEILGHSDGEYNLDRLNNSGAFLWNHLRDDQRGCVEKAWVTKNRAYCKVRFSSNPAGEELMRDMADGIKRNVSFAYDPKVSVLVKTDENDCDTYRVIDWEAFEVSSVSIPADPSVGLDRGQSQSQSGLSTISIKEREAVPETIDKEGLLTEERARVESILKVGESLGMNEIAQKGISEGWTFDQAKLHMYEEKAKRQKESVEVRPVGNQILGAKDLKKYSLLRAINAGLLEGNWSKAGFEKEVSDEIARQCGKESVNGLYVPVRDLTVRTNRVQTRAQNVGSLVDGGALVQTDLLVERMVEFLYNKTAVAQLGATYLSGLTDNIDIPRETGAATAYWISSEGDTASETQIPFETFGLRPRDLFGLVQVTRRMMQQVEASENLVRTRLLRTLNTELDRVCLHGSGINGEPRGIANTPGINAVPIATNGGPLTWANIIRHEELISSFNADVSSMAYLTNSAVRGLLKRTLMNPAGTDAQWIWQNGSVYGSSMVNGYRAEVSNNVTRLGTKGTGTNLSAMFFGDWENLFIGEWGILEILPNPFGAAFRSGGMEFLAKVTCDIAVARPQAFSYSSDIVTT